MEKTNYHPTYSFMIDTKNAIYDTYDDLLKKGISKKALYKNHRLFYIGIFLIIFVLLIEIIRRIIKNE